MQTDSKQYLQNIIKQEYNNILLREQFKSISPKYQNIYPDIDYNRKFTSDAYSGDIGIGLDRQTFDFYSKQLESFNSATVPGTSTDATDKNYKFGFTIKNWFSDKDGYSDGKKVILPFPIQEASGIKKHPGVLAWIKSQNVFPVIYDKSQKNIADPNKLRSDLINWLKQYQKNSQQTTKQLRNTYEIYYQVATYYVPGRTGGNPGSSLLWFGDEKGIQLSSRTGVETSKMMVKFKMKGSDIEILDNIGQATGVLSKSGSGGIQYREYSTIERMNMNKAGVLDIRKAGGKRYEAVQDITKSIFGIVGIEYDEEHPISEMMFPALYNIPEEDLIAGGVNWSRVTDRTQLFADYVGIVAGPVVDVPNGIVYMARDRYLEGAISILASIPVVGDAMAIVLKNIISGAIKMVKGVVKGGAITVKAARKFYVTIVRALMDSDIGKRYGFTPEYIKGMVLGKGVECFKGLSGKILTKNQADICVQICKNIAQGCDDIVKAAFRRLSDSQRRAI